MLILTRKPGESLYIGDDIKISIVELKGHQIRIGIEAPKECRVYREEIYLAIMEENKSAAVFDTETEKLPKAQVATVRPVKPRALSGLSVRRKVDKVEAKETAVKSESSVVVRRKRPKKNDE